MEALKPWVKWAIAGLVIFFILAYFVDTFGPSPEEQRRQERLEDARQKLDEFNRLRQERESEGE